jgi:1-acyl-sn-glycerol-3-phosphate acyltransferase
MALNDLLYCLGRPIAELYTGLMFDLDVVQHAPLSQGAKIIAANHPSTTDPILMAMLTPEHMCTLIDDTLFKVPLFGRYLRLTGQIPVIPGQGRAAFDKACRLLERGQTVGIFPEGHISPLGGGFYQPRTGTARLALHSGAPVIPVGIHLQHERIHLVDTMVDGHPKTGTWYLDGPYAVTVGQAIHLAGDIKDRPYVRSASEHIMQCIIQLAHESARRMETSMAPRPVNARLAGGLQLSPGDLAR